MYSKALVWDKCDLEERSTPSNQQSNRPTFKLLDEVEYPALFENDIAIEIQACGLPTNCVKELKTSLLASKDLSYLPIGYEISGRVTAVGDKVQRIKINDNVTGLIPLDSTCSGCGTACVLSEFDVTKKPDSVSHVDAAASIGDGLRAYTALWYHSHITTNDTVLITSAASGFGIIACQLANAWGAKVIAVVNSEEEVIFLRKHLNFLAAIVELSKKRKSFVDTCLEETAGLGVDCLIDSGVNLYPSENGFSYTNETPIADGRLMKHEIVSLLAAGGKWITQEARLQLDPPESEVLHVKGCSIHFLFEHSWLLSKASQGKYLHILNDIVEKIEQGVLRPMIYETIALADSVDGMKRLKDVRIGRMVVTP